jgi:hypothetical protein
MIIFLAINTRCEYHADRPRGKVVEFTPNHRADIKAIIGAIEMVSFLIFSVVNGDVKAT